MVVEVDGVKQLAKREEQETRPDAKKCRDVIIGRYRIREIFLKEPKCK